MLRVYYKGPDGKVVRYACPKAHLDNKEARCVAFSGESDDNAVAAELLRVVQPAAIEAAMVATQQQSESRREVLEALGRDLQAAQYRADRAARQYEATDPVNRLVAQELERRWNVALEEVKDLEARIRSENASQEAAKVGTADEMRSLADDLEAVWNSNYAQRARLSRPAHRRRCGGGC
jgi:hypothetical protein